MSALDGFWQAIDAQLEQLRTAKTPEDVIRVLGGSAEGADAFFAGGGGDDLPQEPLMEAGWVFVWREAPYYWCMAAPNDAGFITYIEGDVYVGNRGPL